MRGGGERAADGFNGAGKVTLRAGGSIQIIKALWS